MYVWFIHLPFDIKSIQIDIFWVSLNVYDNKVKKKLQKQQNILQIYETQHSTSRFSKTIYNVVHPPTQNYELQQNTEHLIYPQNQK